MVPLVLMWTFLFSLKRRSGLHRASGGFTLVEMAVVVALAGVLLSMGIAIANSLMDNTRRAVTKERMAAIKDIMAAYFVTNHRFPCPDTGDNTGANQGRDGVENRAVGGVVPDPTSACSAAGAGNLDGTVPYLTLGLPREKALDGWGNFLSYRLDTANNWHLSATFPPPPAVCPNIPAALSVFSAPAIAEVGTAVFVVLSHGANGLGAFNQGTTNGSRNTLPPAANAAEFGNTQVVPAGPAGYRNYAYSDVAATPFDDSVGYSTKSELAAVMLKAGKATLCE